MCWGPYSTDFSDRTAIGKEVRGDWWKVHVLLQRHCYSTTSCGPQPSLDYPPYITIRIQFNLWKNIILIYSRAYLISYVHILPVCKMFAGLADSWQQTPSRCHRPDGNLTAQKWRVLVKKKKSLKIRSRGIIRKPWAQTQRCSSVGLRDHNPGNFRLEEHDLHPKMHLVFLFASIPREVQSYSQAVIRMHFHQHVCRGKTTNHTTKTTSNRNVYKEERPHRVTI